MRWIRVDCSFWNEPLVICGGFWAGIAVQAAISYSVMMDSDGALPPDASRPDVLASFLRCPEHAVEFEQGLQSACRQGHLTRTDDGSLKVRPDLWRKATTRSPAERQADSRVERRRVTNVTMSQGVTPTDPTEQDETAPDTTEPNNTQSQIAESSSEEENPCPASIPPPDSESSSETLGRERPTRRGNQRVNHRRASHEDVVRLFEYWRTTLDHPQAGMPRRTDPSYRYLSEALSDLGFDRCCAAIRGIRQSAFHMGDNDDGTRYDGITVLFRVRDRTNKFIAWDSNPPSPVDRNTRATRRSIRATMDAMGVTEDDIRNSFGRNQAGGNPTEILDVDYQEMPASTPASADPS